MNSKTNVLMLCALAVLLNVVLGEAVSMLKIPLLFLDTIGTIFIAATFGMRYGIMTGIVTNVVMAFWSGPLTVAFALVNVAVAIVVALIAKKGFSYPKALLAGVILAFVCPMIGAPIRLALFGGFTGSGTDIVILAIKASGQELITATYWGAVSGNVVDKIVSSLLVAAFLKTSVCRQFLRTKPTT